MFFLGGVINHTSTATHPVANSVTEAEINGLTVAALSSAHVQMTWMQTVHGSAQ